MLDLSLECMKRNWLLFFGFGVCEMNLPVTFLKLLWVPSLLVIPIHDQ